MGGMRLRLLAMGTIMAMLGAALYAARGTRGTLALLLIGVALIAAGVIYPGR